MWFVKIADEATKHRAVRSSARARREARPSAMTFRVRLRGAKRMKAERRRPGRFAGAGVRLAWLLLIGCGFCAIATAGSARENARHQMRFGEYTVHFGAVRSPVTPEAGSGQPPLRNGEAQVSLNVFVEKGGVAVGAAVRARATDLDRKVREVAMREIEDHGMISYVGMLRDVPGSEVLDFELDILPEGSREPLLIQFRERFGSSKRRLVRL
jgi:hypothetical protein